MDLTFFMIVTGDRDPYIADYAIKSLSLVKNLDFKLIVYSNYVDPRLKKLYFSKWEEIEYVSIIKNNHHDNFAYVKTDGLEGYQEGNYDLPGIIWDIELPKIHSKYIGIIDADFEIFRPNFIYAAYKRLKDNEKLLGISTGYYQGGITHSKKLPKPLIGLKVIEKQHWPNYFLIYNRKNIDFNVSTNIRWNVDKERYEAKLWDTHSYLQEKHIEKGFKMDSLGSKYHNQWIHYGAFAKNTFLDESNIKWYRILRILAHRGVFTLPYSNYPFKLLKNIVLRKFEDNRSVLHPDD